MCDCVVCVPSSCLAEGLYDIKFSVVKLLGGRGVAGMVSGLEQIVDIKPLGLKCGSKWFFAGVVDMFDLTQLLVVVLVVAWRRRLATTFSTLEDVVPNSYCLVSIGCAGAYDLPEAPGSHGGRCELNLWRGWYCWTCVASSRPACSSRVLPRRVESMPAVAGERPMLACGRLGIAAMPYCFVLEVPAAGVVFGAKAAAPVVVHAGQFLLSGFA